MRVSRLDKRLSICSTMPSIRDVLGWVVAPDANGNLCPVSESEIGKIRSNFIGAIQVIKQFDDLLDNFATVVGMNENAGEGFTIEKLLGSCETVLRHCEKAKTERTFNR